MNTGCCLTPFFIHTAQDPSQETVLPTGTGFPTTINAISIMPQRCAQNPISKVMPESVELTLNTSSVFSDRLLSRPHHQPQGMMVKSRLTSGSKIYKAYAIT